MSFLSRIASAFGIQNKRELSATPPQWGVRWLPVYEAGTLLTYDEACRVSTVWACMDWLVRCIAPRPWHVFELDGDRRTLRRDDPLEYVLNTRPNPEMTALALREALQYAAIGFGNGYAEIVRNGRGEVTELWPIEPDRVLPWRKEQTDEFGAEGELGYRIMQYVGGQVWVPASRVFHLRGPASMNGVAGDNLLVRASRAIAVAASAQQFSASFFRNGSILTGVLETEKRIGDESVIANIRAQWAERYAGPQNSGKPLVLPEGLKWKEIAGDPNRSALIETRKLQIEEICRYFGVPLHAIGVQSGSHGYGSNIEQMGIEAVRSVLRPWAERFEQEADEKLLSGRGPVRETRIDLSELTMGDFKSQVEAAGIAVEKGLLTLNEARARFGWNNLGPDGDVHFLPSTAKPLEQVLEPPAALAPPGLPAAPLEEDDQNEGEEDAPKKSNRTDAGEGMDNAARQAVSIVFEQALERYSRVLRNRRADLAKKPAKELEQNLADERERLAPKLLDECSAAALLLKTRADFKAELLGIAKAVEQGEPPKLAAQRLVETLGAA